jgi:hypothetical protein
VVRAVVIVESSGSIKNFRLAVPIYIGHGRSGLDDFVMIDGETGQNVAFIIESIKRTAAVFTVGAPARLRRSS